MRDSLPRQVSLASSFLARAWPGLLDQVFQGLGDRRHLVRSLLVCGCGDSHCAALGAEFGLRLWTGLPVRAADSMSASRYWIDDAGPGALVLGISSSGEVARTIEALERARLAGAHTLALTCTAGSTLGATADVAIVSELPAFPFGPGLISYLAALLGTLAVAATLGRDDGAARLTQRMAELPALVEQAIPSQTEQGEAFADLVAEAAGGVFLGSGPCRGAAEYAAAKVMETAGIHYRAQDVEEWAHLEYFVEPADSPTWLLTAGGRASTREVEIEVASQAVGRRLQVTRWQGGTGWSDAEREALAPFGLWPAPVAFAQRLMVLRDQEPFRGFGGGRSLAEGGGASRIRSSARTLRESNA
ncbi:MAG: SIS domain-containing protein [Anaerolineales bacterium]|nr:SIS domain-containing protein [Anaerolineales bacterium]